MPPLVPPDPPLTDGVVTLRSWRDTDADAIAAMMDEPEIARWTRAPTPYRQRDAIEWLATHSTLMRRRSELPLAVVDAETGALLGSVSIRFPADDRGEFGYLVAAEARGRGVGARALRLFARWALVALELPRLEVMVQPENVASLAVAQRVGFRREGIMRSQSAIRGRRVDLMMLAMLPGELREE
jgi:RimJ/RimL family protein N-acetyltransferase